MTKKVLLAYDCDGWCWHRRACALQKYSPPDIAVDVIPQSRLTPDLPDRYDGTLVFSWPDSPIVSSKVWTFVANEGCMHPFMPQSDNYTERTASRQKNRDTARQRIPKFRGVITINHRTVEFLRDLNPNTHLLRTGVDCDVFRPLRPVRTSPPYRIGWCGKSFDDPKKWTPKGYHEVLLPLMERFRGDDRIEWVINRRSAADALSEAEMVQWFNNIDLLLVTSCSEGTPSVILEAMACGRSFLSTPVGIVPHVEDHGVVIGGWNCAAGARTTAKHAAILLQHFIDESEEGHPAAVGACGRDFIQQHFNWTTLAEQWLRLIAS